MCRDVLELTGRIDEGVVDSHLLRRNPLDDPHQRPIWVYTPPGYDGGTDRYPVVYMLLGYGGTLPLWRNPMPYRRPVPELIDLLFAPATPRR